MKRFTTLAMMALVSMTLLSACGKKGGSSSTVVGGSGIVGACTNCGGISAVPILQVPVSAYGINGSVTIYGNQAEWAQAQQQAAYSAGQSPLFYYRGQVIIEGQLQVATKYAAGNCSIFPGAYNLRTVTAGFMQQKIFNRGMNVIIEGAGNPSLTASLYQGSVMAYDQRVYLDFDLIQGPHYVTGAPANCGTQGTLELL